MSSSTSDSVREIEVSSTISTDSRASKTASPALSEAGSCTVLCVGGGLDGLIAGITLAAAGVDCHIFDQLGSPSDHKSPDIGLQRTEELDMWLQVHNVKCETVRSAGRQVLDEDGEAVVEDARELSYVSWEGLYSALRKAFPSENFHPYSKVVAVDLSQVDSVSLELDSGEHYTGNLLLATDGINSGLRSQLLPSCQPTYSGYMAWQGVALLEDLSPEAQVVLGNKSTLYKGLNLHIQAHPVPPHSSTPDQGMSLGWTWFNNQEVQDLPGLIVDWNMKIHPYSVAVGRLSRAVADAVAKAADGAMPAALAELVRSSRSSMSVTSVTDLVMPCHAVSRVAFVGESGCVVRPHQNFNSVHVVIQQSTLLAETLRKQKFSIDKALQVWGERQLRQATAMISAAAAAGNRLQGM